MKHVEMKWDSKMNQPLTLAAVCSTVFIYDVCLSVKLRPRGVHAYNDLAQTIARATDY